MKPLSEVLPGILVIQAATTKALHTLEFRIKNQLSYPEL